MIQEVYIGRTKIFHEYKMAYKNRITLPSSAISKKIAKELCFDESIKYGEDYFFWLDCYKNGFENVFYMKNHCLYNYDENKFDNKYGIFRLFNDFSVRYSFFKKLKLLNFFITLF